MSLSTLQLVLEGFILSIVLILVVILLAITEKMWESLEIDYANLWGLLLDE
jgi:hypothetical protein